MTLNTSKAKAPGATNTEGSQKNTSKPRKFSAKSTATEAQHERILNALRLRPHTSYELRRLGSYQCPTRIKELREMGYEIATDRVTLIDDEGYAHANCALYSLIAEPMEVLQ